MDWPGYYMKVTYNSRTRLLRYKYQVFICKGPSSKVYHKSDRCRGLSNCSTEISKVTTDEAKKLGRRACKIEY